MFRNIKNIYRNQLFKEINNIIDVVYVGYSKYFRKNHFAR